MKTPCTNMGRPCTMVPFTLSSAVLIVSCLLLVLNSSQAFQFHRPVATAAAVPRHLMASATLTEVPPMPVTTKRRKKVTAAAGMEDPSATVAAPKKRMNAKSTKTTTTTPEGTAVKKRKAMSASTTATTKTSRTKKSKTIASEVEGEKKTRRKSTKKSKTSVQVSAEELQQLMDDDETLFFVTLKTPSPQGGSTAATAAATTLYDVFEVSSTTHREEIKAKYIALARQSKSDAPSLTKGSSSTAKSLYDLLGVSPTATREEIKAKYIALVRKSHPDALLHSPGHQPIVDFTELTTAWKILSDSKLRKRYDRNLRAEQISAEIAQWAGKCADVSVAVLGSIAIPFFRRTTATFQAAAHELSLQRLDRRHADYQQNEA